jgi:hypothetical chaperone protein
MTAALRPRFCAIDFGTSNSAIAIAPRQGSGMELVAVEQSQVTLPTAAFYLAEGPGLQNLPRLVGRAAISSYVEGTEGRLMRSMKSVLGSSLMDQPTDIGAGRTVRFQEVISSFLHHLKTLAEHQQGATLDQVVMGRPVHFVDDDAARDAQAQSALEEAARSVGFRDIRFQYEPLAAAFHYEAGIETEQRVLVADIGGGTSDFSVVRVGPQRCDRPDRRDDVLANHGLHIAGTDFDRRIELAGILRELGYGSLGPSRNGQPALEVPSRVYFDLATWHLINPLYRPQRLAEIRAMKGDYADERHHTRLMRVLTEQLGHDLVGRAEQAKIELAQGGQTTINLGLVERGLTLTMAAAQAEVALQDDLSRIVGAAAETLIQAGVSAAQIDAIYFTGGSTALRPLTRALEALCPQARAVHGERLASVATGLGIDARRCFS